MKTIQQRMERLRTFLEENKTELFKKQHRDSKSKRTFRLRGSFKVGVGSTQPGNKQYIGKSNSNHLKHPFRNTAVYIESIPSQLMNGKISAVQYRAYKLARKIFKMVDPEFMSGECLINFSRMNSKSHHVKRHTDNEDISHQYALALGEYNGAQLRCYDSAGNFTDFDYRYKIVKLDGRLPHEVVGMKEFQGERFSIIAYKNYDSRMSAPGPIIEKANFVTV